MVHDAECLEVEERSLVLGGIRLDSLSILTGCCLSSRPFFENDSVVDEPLGVSREREVGI
jgi:hypothetical protein